MFFVGFIIYTFFVKQRSDLSLSSPKFILFQNITLRGI